MMGTLGVRDMLLGPAKGRKFNINVLCDYNHALCSFFRIDCRDHFKILILPPSLSPTLTKVRSYSPAS